MSGWAEALSRSRSVRVDSLSEDFDRAFRGAARRIRRRMAVRKTLTGLLVGTCLATALSVAAWALAWRGQRLGVCLAAVAGALGGLLHWRVKSWSETRIALFLDRVLVGEESITTALELARDPDSAQPALAPVLQRACVHLRRSPSTPLPLVWQRQHWLVPLLLAAMLLFALMPLPPLPEPANIPGNHPVQHAKLPGIKQVQALRAPTGADAIEKKKLRQISQAAEQLQRDLAKGVPLREAQARLGKLQEAVRRERQSFGTAAEKAGLQAAINSLSGSPELADARAALARADLASLEQAVNKLSLGATASTLQRQATKLRQAARDAEAQGAPRVARALREQARRLENSARGVAQRRALRRLLQSQLKSPPATPAGNKALANELATLTDTKRHQLAKQLRNAAATTPEQAQAQKALAKALESKSETQRLIRQLQSPPPQQPPAPSVQHQRQLRQAERALAQAQRQLHSPPQQPAKPASNGSPQGHTPLRASPASAAQTSAANAGAASTPGRNGKPGSGQAGGLVTKNGRGQGSGTGSPTQGSAAATQKSPVSQEPLTAAELRLRVAEQLQRTQKTGTPIETVRGTASATTPSSATSESVEPSHAGQRGRGVQVNPVPSEYQQQVQRYFRDAPQTNNK